jgi:hypothetical protein
MPTDQLAQLVVRRFNAFKEFLPYLAELRKRFNELPRGHANIAGCRTWTEFCENVLGRTDRAVRKALASAGEPQPAKPTNILRRAFWRILPICYFKDKHEEHAHVRFSVSEDGYLLLTASNSEKETVCEEIPEASILRPGGPGLFAGDFGCVNLSSDPFDFTLEALRLLPALDHGDPTIIYRGNTNLEFRFKENFVVYIMPLQFHGSPKYTRPADTKEDHQARVDFDARQQAASSAIEESERRRAALNKKVKELLSLLPENIKGEFYGDRSHLHGLTLEQLEHIVEALQAGNLGSGTF